MKLERNERKKLSVVRPPSLVLFYLSLVSLASYQLVIRYSLDSFDS